MRTGGVSYGQGASGEDGQAGLSASGSSEAGVVSRALLSGTSIEISPLDETAVSEAAARLRPSSDVYIAALPRADYRQIARAAAALRRAGLTPVPHIAARTLPGRAELSEFLVRLASDAGCEKALLVAGDLVTPRGSYASSLDVLQSGLLQKHGFKSIGIAGHPEGHHSIHKFQLWNSLMEKIRIAQESGLAVWVVTQFCFEAEPVIDWLRVLRRNGASVPVRIGVAGPATVTTLLNYAVRCGVGNSLQTLMAQPKRFGRLLTVHTPDKLLGALAGGLGRPETGNIGLHIFPFGGLARSLQWLEEAGNAVALSPGRTSSSD